MRARTNGLLPLQFCAVCASLTVATRIRDLVEASRALGRAASQSLIITCFPAIQSMIICAPSVEGHDRRPNPSKFWEYALIQADDNCLPPGVSSDNCPAMQFTNYDDRFTKTL